jgi:hypothetical protein
MKSGLARNFTLHARLPCLLPTAGPRHGNFNHLHILRHIFLRFLGRFDGCRGLAVQSCSWVLCCFRLGECRLDMSREGTRESVPFCRISRRERRDIMLSGSNDKPEGCWDRSRDQARRLSKIGRTRPIAMQRRSRSCCSIFTNFFTATIIAKYTIAHPLPITLDMPGPKLYPPAPDIQGIPTKAELDAYPRLNTWEELKDTIGEDPSLSCDAFVGILIDCGPQLDGE